MSTVAEVGGRQAQLADVADIRARIAERDAAEAQAASDYAEMMCPDVRPLLKVAESYVDYIQNPHGRIMTGVHEIDLMMRGIGRGELCFVYGQLHQGKTQFLLNMVAHNADKRILYFSPDEMAEEVLTKLIAIKHKVDIEVLETKIKAGDEEAIELLKRAATRDFPNLAIVDEGMALRKLREIRLQLENDVWQAKCDLHVIDYLGSIPGYADEGQAAKALKAFTKNEKQRMVCIQQSRKSEERRGTFIGVHGMLYGGQNEATHLIEVTRPADRPYISEAEQVSSRNVLAWGLWKNKRPPCRTGSGKLFLHPRFGHVETWGVEHQVGVS